MSNNKNEIKLLDFIVNCWKVIPTNVLYATCAEPIMVINDHLDKCGFIYSFCKLDNPSEPELVETNSACFKVFRLNVLSFTEPIGFIFIPTLPESYKLRYNPFSVVATNNNVTTKSFQNIEKKVLFSYDELELVWLSNGVEIISNIWSKMGIYPEGE